MNIVLIAFLLLAFTSQVVMLSVDTHTHTDKLANTQRCRQTEKTKMHFSFV